MSTEIFNKTIGRIVDVPDEAVDAYLAQDAYRKVKTSDRGPGPVAEAPVEPAAESVQEPNAPVT